MLVADHRTTEGATITSTLPTAQHANLHFVTPTLAIGGDLHTTPLEAARQLNEIDKLGITHIVDCRIEWSDEDVIARHLPSISYPECTV